MKTKMIKSFSLVLTLIMLLSAIPFTASAADPIKLTKTNVKIIPPVPNPAVAPYGISYSEIALVGGTVWYVDEDGTETIVPGTFSWLTAGTNAINVGTYTPMLKFEPDDQTAYSKIGLMAKSSYADAIVSGEWPTVTIIGIPTPQIKTVPTVKVVMGVDQTYADAKITGGTAVDKDTQNVVAGNFVIADDYKDMPIEQNKRIIVRFVPDDLEAHTDTAIAEVLPKYTEPIRFVDESGNDIIPEITIEYTNAKIGQYNFGYYLKPYTNLTDSDGASFNFTGLEGENDYITVGTKKYKINASAQNQNYEKSVLEFILTVTPKPLDITVSYVNNQILISRTTTDRINGSFELYVDGVKLADGVKIEGAQSSAKYGWTPKTSGTHTVKAVYVPAENDTVSIEPAETQVQMNLTRALTLPEGSGYIAKVNGSSNFTSVACGDTVSLSCTFEDFECWIITGADGKTADLGTVMTEKTVTDANGGVTFVTEEGDLSCANIIFAMPDEDITVTYKLKEADTGNDPVDGEKDFFAQVKAFFENLFNGETNCPVLKWIINVFNVIVNFFTGLFVK